MVESQGKMCLLCFNGPNQINRGNLTELYKMCCKYLHSALTKENPISSHSVSDNLQLCGSCINSVERLFHLTQQLEMFQKSVSDFAFLFSVQIMNRRRKNKNEKEKNKTKIVCTDYDVSDLSICDSWNTNVPAPIICDEEISKNKSHTAEDNINADELDPLIIRRMPENKNTIDVVFEVIKCEFTQSDSVIESEDMLDNNIDMQDNCDKMPTKNDFLNNVTVTQQNVDVSPLPLIVELQELQCEGRVNKATNTELIIEEANIIHSCCHRKEKDLEGHQSKSDVESTDKISEVSSKPKDNNKGKSEVQERQQILLEISNSNATTTTPETRLDKSNPESGTGESASDSSDKADVTLTPCSEKRFRCDKCPKIFKRRYHLKTHTRTHTGEKPYNCELCDKKLSSRQNWKKHIKAHKKQKILESQFDACTNQSIGKSSLTFRSELQSKSKQSSEKQNHNREPKKLPYKCSKCTKGFADSLELARHVRHVHKIRKPPTEQQIKN